MSSKPQIMVRLEAFKKFALHFEGAVEQPHFEKLSYRVRKKIFATLDVQRLQVVLKLSEIDQSVFVDYDDAIFYPVPGRWGKQGWTAVELNKVPVDMLKDAITCSYCQVAPKKLAEKYG